jgi:uncharacterized protein YqjF (DUF2071 family)
MTARSGIDDAPPAHCPEPVRRPVMVQRWDDVVFLHWSYAPDDIARLLPRGVSVDTHDELAWVGLVPFHMRRLGFPGVTPLPGVGSFPEVNVRTYVRVGGRRAVWFCSLDVDRWIPTFAARFAYRLPYCAGEAAHARAGASVTSTVDRRWPRPTGASGATTRIAVRIGDRIDAADPFVRFLTGRWGLVSAGRRGALRYAPVDHDPWQLHRASVEHLEDTLVVAAGFAAPQTTPHAMWSPGVDVRVGRPRRMEW